MDLSRVGLSTFLFPGMNLPKWLELARELGLGGVELRADPLCAYPPELAVSERSRLRHQAQELGLWLTVHAPIYDVNFTSTNPALAAASLGEVAASLDLAHDVGADLVVLHPGHVHEDYAQLDGAVEAAWQRMMFCLELLLAKVEGTSVRLALENKQRARVRDLVLTWEEHRRVLDALPALGACLDLGHLFTVNGDFRPYLQALEGRLIHVHLHDNQGERDEHLGLGRGSVPWLAFLGELDRVGYRGRLVLEIPDPEALRASVRLIAQV